MPKFADGYKTSLGSMFNTDKLHEALSEALIRADLLASSLDVKMVGHTHPVFVTALKDAESIIPLFTHPFVFKTRDGKQILATDMRLCLSRNMFDGTLASLPKAVTNTANYVLTRTRAILNLVWLDDDVESLKLRLWFSTMMFTRWITDAMKTQFSLDGRDQIVTGIVSSFYYQSLFSEATDYDEETLQKWKIHTLKVIQTDSKLVDQIFAKMPKMVNVASLIEALKLGVENVRLQNLEVGLLLTMLKNTWYGTNSRELITISLEHPPTWMAIVYAAIHEKTFKQSMLYKIAERIGKRGIADEYAKEIYGILAEYAITKTHQELVRAGLA